MKRVLLAAAMAAALGPAAMAGERMDAIDRVGEAIAFSVGCPKARFNTAALRRVAIEYGIDLADGSADSTMMNQTSAERVRVFKNYTEDELCAVAIDLYGPDGRRIPDLLSDDR